MALRMLLVGVVAGLGLSQPRLGLTQWGPTVATAGAGVLGVLVPGEPAEGPQEALTPVGVTEGRSWVAGLAIKELLLDWGRVWKARADAVARHARRLALAAALEQARAEEAMEEVITAESYSCVGAGLGSSPSPRIVEVELIEPAGEAKLAETVSDAGFLVALEEVVSAFAADREMAAGWEDLPPAPEAVGLAGGPEAGELVAEIDPEPLYPGIAYALNEDHDGIDDPMTAPRAGVDARPVGESRLERLATAVRLTGQAIQAWTRIFVQTGPVGR
ncbi:MAG: hypothetical protein KatS3mg108_3324 [Isosphaeraceae bacterium]|jgi:hypothetical protein|nr:MAG: hypothetical protein KatS3mg108_3324 [Isosphaeraceae bacterium]